MYFLYSINVIEKGESIYQSHFLLFRSLFIAFYYKHFKIIRYINYMILLSSLEILRIRHELWQVL